MKRVRSWIEDKVLEWADKIDDDRRELKFNHQHQKGGDSSHVIIEDDPIRLAPRLTTDRDIPNDQYLDDHIPPPIPLEDLVMDKYRGTEADIMPTGHSLQSDVGADIIPADPDAMTGWSEEFWK